MSAVGKALIGSLDGDDLVVLRRALGLPEVTEQATPETTAVEPLLTVVEVAGRVGAHPETIRRAIRAGALSAVAVGRSWRIAVDDLDAWLSPPDRAQPRPPRGRRPRRRTASRRSLADALATLRDPL